MREEQQQFLVRFGRPPARLNAEQTAWVINCQPHDIPVLVGARLLKPLGNPLASSVKYFATADLLELTHDRAWLSKVTATIYAHWQRQNAARKRGRGGIPENKTSAPPANGVALAC